MTTILDMKKSKAKAKRQRDNWKKRSLELVAQLNLTRECLREAIDSFERVDERSCAQQIAYTDLKTLERWKASLCG